MSNPESFIEEVTEEVRRDRLFGLMKRYGWIAIVLVLALVGGAAYVEWQKARDRASAQSFGDGIVAALGIIEPEARAAALADLEVEAGSEQALIRDLIAAANAASTKDEAGAAEVWTALAANTDVPEIYQHLALLKSHLAGGTGDAAEDAAVLDRLATPGAPFRPLAMEQQALAALAAGDTAGALSLFEDVLDAPGTTDILRRRAIELIVALGGTPDNG